MYLFHKLLFVACGVRNIDCLAGVGAAYHGSVNQTRSGYTCRAWNMQTPHTHDLAELGEHTYCMVPGAILPMKTRSGSTALSDCAWLVT